MQTFSRKILNILSNPQFILLVLMSIMLYLRIVPIHKIVFTDWPSVHGNYVNFASDDAVYHMRLVHNTLHHFPKRIFFDPFTHYPFGSQIHFGPLFTLLIAATAMIFGAGHPSAALIDGVGAYLPPVLGALCLIPTYFIGKKIFGKNAGLLAAVTLAFLPGEFFQRSTLGFADHHIAEVLFSTSVFAFFIYALDKAIKLKDNCAKYAFAAGIFYGLYLLAWPAALLLGAILFIFFLLQFSIERHLNHQVQKKHLLLIAIVTFVLPLLMVLPYSLQNPHLQMGYYSLTQPTLLALLLSSIVTMYLVTKMFDKSRIKRCFYLLSLIGMVMLFILLVHSLTPELYNQIIAGIKLLFKPRVGMTTVAEVWPSIFDRNTGGLTFDTLRYNFFLSFPFSIAAIALLFEKVWKKNIQPGELLLLVWSLAMMSAMFAQGRFAYYFAINASILTGYFVSLLFDYLGEIFFTESLVKNSKIRTSVFWLSVTMLSAGLAYPATSLAPKYTYSYGPRLTKEAYDTLTWLKNHTPDPQGRIIDQNFAYASGNFSIPEGRRDKYSYPTSAYGIMNWWDNGHQITYVAERIPNANPFQQGIIEEDHFGAAAFFTATDEQAALANLNELETRYVLIDNATANKQYSAMLLWQGDEKNRQDYYIIAMKNAKQKKIVIKIPTETKDFSASMLNKLYFNDGNGLRHFRLVHESAGKYIVNAKSYDVRTGSTDSYFTMSNDNYDQMLRLALRAKKPTWLNGEKKQLLYAARRPVKWAKIFEKVRGATIIGKAKEGITVTINLTLLTANGRLFIYKQRTKSDHGHYKFVVPYPTEPMQGDGYNYDIIPLTQYIIKAGEKETMVAVTENDVMKGNLIVS